MKNQSESDFKSKFHLLNSQENSEEIVWSSSDSSDYENKYFNENFTRVKQTVNRKRKRGERRKKISTNTCPLNITFVNTSLEDKSERNCAKSPILQKANLSPILTERQQYFAPMQKVLNSPILACNSKKSTCIETTASRSPIIDLKLESPKVSPRVRKKLFSNNNNIEIKPINKESARSKSPVLNCSKNTKKSRPKDSIIQNNSIKFHNNITQDIVNNENKVLNHNIPLEDEITFDKNLNDTLSSKMSSVGLLERVKSYFDGHFSSETPSLQSISEYDTSPKETSKTSEEIEIINSQTEAKHLPEIVMLENRSSSDSLRSFEFREYKSKKVRYKKGGLAYRLNSLLKKQKANISLWQHERFLAANSNFVIPNDNFTAFHIQNVTFQYGCYVLQVIDVMEKKYVIVINNLNMNCNNLEQFNVFKLYKPFSIIDYNSEYQLIVNVSKFECTDISK
ncbi:uncharacterized protein LOC112044873 [Bicyclus anynana]|uniref:Uncharacterized protein LOC112044873 n=1 Tax=Bicyclus anynana TaxID=110368 RepID=A0A6J1MUT5_BICAN|nr:uncharacterized protein LOC112044873 [Bicyclus anynana]